jgi:hypothetical protein
MDGLRDTLGAGGLRREQLEAQFIYEHGFAPSPLVDEICRHLEPPNLAGRMAIYNHIFQSLKDHYDEVFENMELDVHSSAVEDIAAQILSIPPTADSMLILEQVLGRREVSFATLVQRRIMETELGAIPDPNNVYVSGARIGLAHASFATVDEADDTFDWVSACYVAEELQQRITLPVPVTFMLLENLGCQEAENLGGETFVRHKKEYFYTGLLRHISREMEERGGFCVYSANGENELAILTFGVDGTEKGNGGRGSLSALWEAFRSAFAENSNMLNVGRQRKSAFGRMSSPTTFHLAEHIFSVRFMEQEVDLATVDPKAFSPLNPAPFVERICQALEAVRLNIDYSYFYWHRNAEKPEPYDCRKAVGPNATAMLTSLLFNKREDHDMACDMFGNRPHSYLHMRPFARLSGEALEYFRTEARARRKYQVLGQTGLVRPSSLGMMLTQNEIDYFLNGILESIPMNAGILRRYSDSSYFILFRDPEIRRKSIAAMVRNLKDAGYPEIRPEILLYEFESRRDSRQNDLKAAYDTIRLAKLLPFSVGFLGEAHPPSLFIVRGGAEDGEADSVSMFLARVANYSWRSNDPSFILGNSRNPLVSFLNKSVIHVNDKMISDFIANVEGRLGINLVRVLGHRPSNLDPYEAIALIHAEIFRVYPKDEAEDKAKEFEEMLRKTARVCPMP